jgi:hypothetical protein
MPELDRQSLLTILITIAAKFSGAKRIDADCLLHDGLGLGGSDFIEFVEEIEREFSVDLESVSPRHAGMATDVSIGTLADIILEQRDVSRSTRS